MRPTCLFVSLLALTLCFAAVALAQNSETGVPPFGSFHGSDFDLASLKTGNLHVRVKIPLWSLPQRAAPKAGLRLVYDMPTWQLLKSQPTSNPSTIQDGGFQPLQRKLSQKVMVSFGISQTDQNEADGAPGDYDLELQLRRT